MNQIQKTCHDNNPFVCFPNPLMNEYFQQLNISTMSDIITKLNLTFTVRQVSSLLKLLHLFSFFFCSDVYYCIIKTLQQHPWRIRSPAALVIRFILAHVSTNKTSWATKKKEPATINIIQLLLKVKWAACFYFSAPEFSSSSEGGWLLRIKHESFRPKMGIK